MGAAQTGMMGEKVTVGASSALLASILARPIPYPLTPNPYTRIVRVLVANRVATNVHGTHNSL
ncbi:MAG: hypothetical protein NVS1B4_24840 [Gemmatimonadaceae bacterium]